LNFTSKLLEQAVDEMATLPGIGRKTALRLVLNLLKRTDEDVQRFGHSFIELKQNVNYCSRCYNISDTAICSICSDHKRDASVLCVVEDIRDVMAIENTQQFKGLYHVLGGIISPMDGVGPAELTIDALMNRLQKESINEIILALPATMEGDTTNFYLFRKIQPFNIKVTNIARGVSVGSELEYTDEVTLGRSIVLRTPFEQQFSR
jgi:recombination protein RecR